MMIKAKDQVKSAPAGSSGSSGGKAKKKKWSKGKTKEKSNNAPYLDKDANTKLLKEIPTCKVITVSVLVDRLKVNGSVARRALVDLESRGLIRKVSHSSKLQIYTRATAPASEEIKEQQSKK